LERNRVFSSQARSKHGRRRVPVQANVNRLTVRECRPSFDDFDQSPVCIVVVVIIVIVIVVVVVIEIFIIFHDRSRCHYASERSASQSQTKPIEQLTRYEHVRIIGTINMSFNSTKSYVRLFNQFGVPFYCSMETYGATRDPWRHTRPMGPHETYGAP
jgi:hypothetical protein